MNTTNNFNNVNSIYLVTVCDDHFAVMLSALIKSIEVNYKSDKTIELFIVDDHIKSTSKSKIRASVTHEKVNLTWLPIEDVIPDFSELPFDSSTFPLNVYVRLFIPSFLPHNCTKAIYLDVDMIVSVDIYNLWKIDLGEHYIGGVVDRSNTVDSKWGGIPNYKELGISADTKYFNSGLLLLNIEKWRSTSLTKDILLCIAENKHHAIFPDQYGLNVVFQNAWLVLDSRWNTFSPSNIDDPFIIHFIGTKPIYTSYENNLNYKKEFYHYLKMTSWSDFQPMKGYRRMLNKLVKIIGKKVKASFTYLNLS